MNEATRRERNSSPAMNAAPERAPDPRVARGLEALNAWAKREGWTRAKKRRVLEGFYAVLKATQDAEAGADQPGASRV